MYTVIYKNIKYLFTGTIFLLNGLGLLAQHDLALNGQMYAEARKSLFLLKNEFSKIPLKGSDALNIQYLNFDNNQEANLTELLEWYFPVENIETKAKDIEKVEDKAIKVLSFNLSTIPLDQETVVIAEQLIQQEQTIVLVFDAENNFSTSGINFSTCSHLIYIRGNTKLQQSLAVQLLFGGIGTQQKLEINLSESFQKGSGYIAEGGIRLGYSPPELVGMDVEILNNIGSIAESAIEAGAFPGCQVLIVKDQQVVYHETWGYHTYAQEKEVQQNDIYDFASVTKITAALPALMKLQGEGKLKLDEPFKKYFPKFEKTNKADLTIRSILAHHAKLKPWIPYWRSTIKKNGRFKWRTFKKKKSRRFPIEITDELYLHRKYKKRIYKAIEKSPLNEKSGYVYSGLAFYLWPEMVSNMVDEDFETHLKKTFYEPLGAATITFNPDRYFSLDRIIPTEKDTFFRKVQIHGKVHDEGAIMMGGVSSNAGLFGAANDLAKLMQMYLNSGTYGGQRFIAEAAIQEFTRCQYCEEGNRRGLGFDKPLIEYDPQKSSVAKDASPDSYGHSGYTGTFTWVDPKHDLIYIFFSNRVYPTRENRKIYELNVRPRIHQLIYSSFLK